ncbi:hypothetical protein ASPZODRAFT_69621 [Penicilliopsis zonata CBS 506.65]|uniref:Cytochrome P450 n=1 Tax=Penicilliopsis zonata CBS 506.65 TaxID=1073090 RepID=A0A1L9SDR0_9EURO|nr:hypothetical protein ASPZODRAFT_69621 [Penicilliopsis zonata CBS 506.65]OJJ45278.1 hypothetical protein ASPZODRAFT_69621 [Penicilliopsis zonata CBS 506.65]
MALVDLESRSFLTGVFFLLFGVLLVYRHLFSKPTYSLPPGPKPLPIVGNILDMVRSTPMDMFTQWHQKFGPIISLRYGQRQVISINSSSIAHDLLDKRGAIYSSRPRLIMASERMLNSMNIGVLPYNKRWNVHHRIISPFFETSMVKRYAPIFDLESKQVIADFLSSNDFDSSLSRFSASIFLGLSYGIHLDSNESTEVTDLDRINQFFLDAMSSMYCRLVELYPFLDLTPYWLAPWKWLAADVERQTTAVHMRHFEFAKSKPTWNWLQEARASKLGSQLPDKELAYVVGTLHQAGGEAIITLSRLLVKVIVLHPECAAQAQKELDQVVGPNRLPNVDDQEDLPYINAMITEAMRWQPVTPLIFPHANTQDDEYMGYHIPKDTMILPNLWAMGYDPEIYPDPTVYRPERWLENTPPHHPAFGFGRRICPGQQLGSISVFLLVARILWAFNTTHAYRDGKKVEIDPWDLKITLTLSSSPFEVEFHARSDKHRKIIEQEWLSTEKDVGVILEEIRPPRRE